MKSTRRGLARGLGAAVIAALMVFTGLGPAGADTKGFGYCLDDANAGGTFIFRKSPDKSEPVDSLQGLRAGRYSDTSGEIMWERTSGAVGYEIIREGRSLGVHDLLSWQLTDLEEDCSYSFGVRAVDRDGNYLTAVKSVRVPRRLPSNLQ